MKCKLWATPHGAVASVARHRCGFAITISQAHPKRRRRFALRAHFRFVVWQHPFGTASDVLMKLAGGPEAIQAYLTELGIKDMIVLNTEKEIGQDWQTRYRNWASPEAAIALLRALHERQGLSKSSQTLLLKYMTESTPGQKRLKGLLPAGTVVAHKTGTSGTQKGITAATNDIGIITLPNGKHMAIAVFVSDSPADEATREGVIAKIAKAVWDAYRNESSTDYADYRDFKKSTGYKT